MRGTNYFNSVLNVRGGLEEIFFRINIGQLIYIRRLYIGEAFEDVVEVIWAQKVLFYMVR